MICEDLIYDVGLHTGQDTAFYLKKGFRVIAIEANPLLAQHAQLRFADACAEGRLRVLSVGVGTETGRFPFYINSLHAEWSSFDQELGSRGCDLEVIDVDVVKLEEIVAEYGVPYYLKIDIEGSDMAALGSIARFPAPPRFVSAENGHPAMLDLMWRLGYRQFKFINQARVPAMRCPSPAREGVEVEHVFELGSSGPFGQETVGEWKSREDVMAEILAYWNNPAFDANVHGWYDLHGQFPRSSLEPRDV
jgi:FkbM family methyltransferase